MIGIDKKNGAEVSSKLLEIQMLRTCEAVKTAQQMERVSAILDTELRQLRRTEREGKMLIEQGVTLGALEEILRAFDGDNHDAG